MQKFTIFSLILSLVIILAIGDMVVHDYLKADTFLDATSGGGTEEELDELPIDELPIDELALEENPTETPEEEVPVEIVVLEPELSADLFKEVGFADPVFKEAVFSGSLFQFISFADQTDAFIYQWNVFEGEIFVGSAYEIKYPTETGAFQGYLTLRDRASALSNIGVVNETNSYGDSSFYFNHKVKTKTVHSLIKVGDTIYAFDYDIANHTKMKGLFELL